MAKVTETVEEVRGCVRIEDDNGNCVYVHYWNNMEYDTEIHVAYLYIQSSIKDEGFEIIIHQDFCAESKDEPTSSAIYKWWKDYSLKLFMPLMNL